MKHKEQEILAKAKKILTDLQGQFYKEENLKKVVFEPKEELLRGENKGKKFSLLDNCNR